MQGLHDVVGISLGLIPLALTVLLAWLILRRIRLWMDKSVKARQDMARGIADIAERLERLEAKLGESQARSADANRRTHLARGPRKSANRRPRSVRTAVRGRRRGRGRRVKKITAAVSLPQQRLSRLSGCQPVSSPSTRSWHAGPSGLFRRRTSRRRSQPGS